MLFHQPISLDERFLLIPIIVLSDRIFCGSFVKEFIIVTISFEINLF